MELRLDEIKGKDAPNVKPWLRHYRSAKYRCSSPSSKYYKRGIKFYMTEEHFKTLWERDNAASLKRPSIDRIFKNKDYTYANCQFIELSKNVCKDNTGSLNVDAKLNEKMVIEIKRKYLTGKYSQRKLASQYGVSQGVICGIMNSKYWKHVHLNELIESVPETKI